jgi:hypothetical protein
MKNTAKWPGVIALAAVIGFAMAACGDGSSGGGEEQGVAPTITTATLPTGTTGSSSWAQAAQWRIWIG